MKHKTHLYLLEITMFATIFASSCQKDDNKIPNPTNGKTTAVFNPDKTYGTVTDVEGNEYKTIVIGTQTWMAENLRATKYRNGDPIPYVADSAVWRNFATGAFCVFNKMRSNDSIATFGRLYNWYAATDSRNIAPEGWHVPSKTEWETLFTYLGGYFQAYNQLKETGTSHWPELHTLASNTTGFTALPSGGRKDDGSAFYPFACWWSSTETRESFAPFYYLHYDLGAVLTYSFNAKYGFSIRCIKD